MLPIGIDLGTTYSAIAKWENTKRHTGSKVCYIQTETRETLPSKVYIDYANNEPSFIVGRLAIKKGISVPYNYVHSVKREMDKNDFSYTIENRRFTPVEISAEILKRLLKELEDVEGPNEFIPEGVIVTVPYYFKENQNRRTREAAIKALSDRFADRCARKGKSLDDLFLGLLPEPIAAGLDYAFNQVGATNINGEKFLVFDLGGGTFDLTVFSLRHDKNRIEFEVLSIDGDDRLGGEDFDTSFYLWLKEVSSIDWTAMSDKQKIYLEIQMRLLVTEAKENLSQSKSTDWIIPGGNQNIDRSVNRTEFEDCINGEKGSKRNFYEEVENKLDAVLSKAKIKRNDLSSVLLIGGSSKIPLFQELIISYFGKEKIRFAEQMDLAVARGAAIYAAFKLDERLIAQGKPRQYLNLWDEIIIKERTAHRLGIDVGNKFYTMILDNSLTPATRTESFRPEKLSDDGKLVLVPKITVLQGTSTNYVPIGDIALSNIYAHNRHPDQIPINITFIAETSLIRLEIRVPKGNADGSDFYQTGELAFAGA